MGDDKNSAITKIGDRAECANTNNCWRNFGQMRPVDALNFCIVKIYDWQSFNSVVFLTLLRFVDIIF